MFGISLYTLIPVAVTGNLAGFRRICPKYALISFAMIMWLFGYPRTLYCSDSLLLSYQLEWS